MTDELFDNGPAAAKVLEEARRQVEAQETALNSLRGSVATVLLGASIVAAVFGAVTFKSGRSDFSTGCEWFAFIVFGATVVASVVVLWPRTFHTEHELAPYIDRLIEGAALDEITVTAHLAKSFEGFREKNDRILACLQIVFAIACSCLGLQVVAWALAVGYSR